MEQRGWDQVLVVESGRAGDGLRYHGPSSASDEPLFYKRVYTLVM